MCAGSAERNDGELDKGAGYVNRQQTEDDRDYFHEVDVEYLELSTTSRQHSSKVPYGTPFTDFSVDLVCCW